MFNPIEARKRLVQERIEKSFQDNVGEQRERESTSDVVEKAYQVGDEKQFNGRNYYVHALNSKGQPLWRLKRDAGKKDDNKQKSSDNNSDAGKTFTDIDGVRRLGGGDLREMGAYSGYQYGDDETITAARYVDDKGNDYWIVSQDVEEGEEEKFDEESDALQRFSELINISKKVDEKAKEASDNALKRAVADEKAKPEVREAAKKELDKRNKKKKTMLSKEDGSKLMGKLMEAWELDSDHKFGERKKWEDKLVDTLNKMGKDMKWFNKNAEVIANANSGDYDDEVEELSDKVEGIDDLFNLVSEIGDDTENEPEDDEDEDDSEDVVDSSNIGEKIISALKSDQGGLNNTRAGKRAQNKIVSAAEDFLKRNPKVKLTDEDLEDIIGGDVDYIEEKYGELRGWNKLNDAIEAYFDVDD